jgi:DNA-binding protein WhiA
MSFASEVKNELARFQPSKKCCQLAELSAILRMDGSFHILGKGLYAFHTLTENAAVARKTFRLLSGLFDVDSEVIVRRKRTLGKGNEYLIYIPSQAHLIQVFNETGILDDQMRIRYDVLPRLVRKNCCAAAYLRGAFLGGGSVSSPQKNCHFELVTDNKRLSDDLRRLLIQFQLNAKISSRKRNYAVYIKGSDEIIRFLALVGAHSSLFKWEDAKILKSIRNQVNRLVNCETSNSDKAVEAAQSQINDINLIKEVFGLDWLTDGLREIAQARLDNPEVAIRELGEMCDPPLSKSAAYHRLRRLHQLANRLRAEGS